MEAGLNRRTVWALVVLIYAMAFLMQGVMFGFGFVHTIWATDLVGLISLTVGVLVLPICVSTIVSHLSPKRHRPTCFLIMLFLIQCVMPLVG